MNKYIYSIIALFMATLCWAQMFVSQAEYFWDTDPGKGNGTSVLATDGSFNSVFEQLTKTGIATPGIGLHKLSVRIKDNMGVWGPVFTNVIDVQQNSVSNILAISQAEYFWDNDPGKGNGTPVLATDGNFNSTYEQLTKTGIALPSAGLHVFNVRIRDNAGVWGPLFKNVINIEASTPSGCWQTLSTKGDHSAGIKTDGTLWTWGSNSNGQLGDGTTIDRNMAIQIGTANNWLKVEAGSDYTVAIKTDGTLWAWGENNYGQLGDGTTIDRFIPTQVGTANNWQSIAAGLYHVSAVKTDGTLWGWGYNNEGELGDGTSIAKKIPTQIGTDTDWTMTSAGSYHTLALKSNGTLWGWGNNSDGRVNGTPGNKYFPVQIGTENNWQRVDAGYSHSVALKTDGTLWSWGRNTYGELGDGTVVSKSIPTQVGTANNWLNASAGMQFTMATKTDGTLWAWGNNYYGTFGNGTSGSTYVISPVKVGSSSDNMQVFAGDNSVLVKTNDGFLKVCGLNNRGGLGDGTNEHKFTYTSISCPSNCLPPTQFSSTNVTSTTATIKWTASNSAPNGGYLYLYSTHTVVGGIQGATSSTTADLTNLLPGTKYYWWVASYCGSSQGNWVPGGSFTTPSTTDTSCWKSAAAGWLHSLAIKTDGTLWAWGYNTYGQFGDGTNTNNSKPTPVGTDNNWLKIAAGYYHSVALKTDGTLWTWGRNEEGQLGDGSNTNKNVITQIGTATDWVSVVAGSEHTVALKSNGTIWAWGENNYGQLGDGTKIRKNVPVQIGTATDWASINAGQNHTLALKTDGTLWAWGYNNSGQVGDGTRLDKLTPIKIGTATNWKSIDGGGDMSIGIKTDGTLWAWGSNFRGALGDGTTVDTYTPIQIGTEANWRSVDAGFGNSSIALKADGTLWTWGSNSNGQLGDGTATNRNIPILIGTAANWQSISAGSSHTLVINTNGLLAGAGDNQLGEIGDGTRLKRRIFTPVACPPACNPPGQFISSNITSSSATLGWTTPSPAPGGGYSYMYSTNSEFGGIEGKTTSTAGNNVTNLLPNTTYYWWVASSCGYNQTNWIPAGSFTTLPTNETGCWENVSSGAYHSLALRSDGTLWAWGSNNNGQLGDGTSTSKNIPVQIGTSTWLKIAAGYSHNVAIKADGTIWTWGSNQHGQLGDGTTTSNNNPTQIGTATDWVNIAVGYNHTFGIKSDGTLWGWGLNDYGLLGDGTTINKNVPVQIGTANDWKMITAGSEHTLAIKTNGTLWGWGNTNNGRVGEGTTTSTIISTPIQIGTAADWKNVSAGWLHSLGMKTDGTLWGWGNNSDGQLGDGTTISKSTPTQIGTGTNWKNVSTNNYSSSVGLKTDGTLWAWGRNTYGQLGDGTTVRRLNPTQIGTATDRKIVAAGDYTTLVINTNGFLSGTGRNDDGEIGDGTNISKPIFTPIACPKDVLAVVENTPKTDQLKVYPNPVSDILTISFDQKIHSVTIYNAAGQLILAKAIDDTKGTIDVSGFVSGLYLVKVNAANGFVKTVKVIKR
ncbi:T9SS C-terminal target domain-containing protein [Chryseobacterium sp. G0162]|uniref:RCC1 domain-containing protein n=1 Tax=Chryseobacterium sp. G0162 TaxID=2487063 RepID=UPI000F4E5749|nr:T9SS type A sorting domain-containing protein [Chryseobacterium sp. G0162]AZB10812.1 T9SS C-terminal target domain-containing protein [Chryseobacterium sp. G0162]